ncbi:MAG: hypothetical protein DRP64_14800, partial [Verrucomicrobia bacterium]
MVRLAAELAHDVSSFIDYPIVTLGAVTRLTEAEMVGDRFLVVATIAGLVGTVTFSKTVVMAICAAS